MPQASGSEPVLSMLCQGCGHRVDILARRRSGMSKSHFQSVNTDHLFTSRSKGTAGTGSTRPRCHGDSCGAQLAWCSLWSGGEEGDTERDRAHSTGPEVARHCRGCRLGGLSLLACSSGPWSCWGPQCSPEGPGDAGGHRKKRQSHACGS